MKFIERLKEIRYAFATSANQAQGIKTKHRLLLSVMSVIMVATALPIQKVSAQVFRLSPKKAKQVVWEAARKRHSKGTLNMLVDRFDLLVLSTPVLKNTSPDNVPIWHSLEERWRSKLGCDIKDYAKPCKLKGIRTADQIVHSFFDLATEYPMFQSEIARFRASLTHPDRYDTLGGPARRIILPSVQRYSWQRLLERQTATQKANEDAFYEAFLNAPKDSTEYKMAKRYFEKQSPPIINFSAQAYAEVHQDEPIFRTLVNNFEADGSLTISEPELNQLITDEVGRINTGIDEVQDTLGEIDDTQKDPINFENNPIEQAKQQERAQAEAAKHALRIEAGRSSIHILSALAGLKNPELGNQLSVVGNAAIDVYETGKGWLEATAGLSSFESLTSLSTVVATGNLIGVAMQVMSLFGPNEPTPEQMILEQIGQLREQISDLRTEMHDRFDRVDQQLDTIYTTMLDRFDKIDVQLGKINGNLTEIQDTLATLDNTLARMERNNFEFLDAGFRRDLLSRMNAVLGYKERTSLNLPYEPQFVDAESYFYTWGTTHAFDALAAGPTQRDYSDARVLGELNSLPPDANLNYLNGWLKANNLPGIADDRIASPRDWLFAARAYVQLAQENPAHMRRILANDPQRIATLESVGADIEKALRAISTITNSATSTVTLGNTEVFSKVLAYYDGKRNDMQNELRRTEAAFVSNVQANTLVRDTAFDLFGGATQSMTHVIPDLASMTCHGTADPLTAPANIQSAMPDLRLRTMADYLHLRTHSVCLSSDWEFVRRVCVIKPPPDEPPCKNYGYLIGNLSIADNTESLVTYTIKSRTISPIGETDVQTEWEADFKPRFEALFAMLPAATTASTATSTPVTNTLQSEVEAWLANQQKMLYGQIANDMTRGGLLNKANELAGAKQLLDTFINFGFNSALEGDDYFHGLVFGQQRIVDRDQMLGTFALSATVPITTMNVLENPRVELTQTGNKRSDALRERGMNVLSAIGALTHQEFIRMIADARQELRVAQHVDALIEPEPPTQPIPIPAKRLFIPVIQR